ncbi:MAG: class I SAM-dependent methyltransferase [Planctomycetaceae bacterium]
MQIQCLEEFSRRVQTGEYRFRKEPCPCGSSTASVKISEVDRYGLPLDSVLCRECGTVRVDPYLDEQSLSDFYSNLYQDMYARATDVADYFHRQTDKTTRVLATYEGRLPPSASILDVGCGAGGGIWFFQQRGFQTAACDYDRALIEYGRSRGVSNLILGSIAELRSQYPGWSFDLIYLYHVFEHVIDPVGLLNELKTVLKPDGRVLIIVPDISQVGISKWPGGDVLQFMHLAHKYNYSREGLRKMAQIAGLHAGSVAPANHQPVSRCPELWIEFGTSLAKHPQCAIPPTSAGDEMLRNLRQTERLYRLGCCPAQIIQATAAAKSKPDTRRRDSA